MDIINANNGLTCYLHKHDNEINSNGTMAALIIRVGSNNEKADEQDISHFLEHRNVRLMSWLPSVKEVILDLNDEINYIYQAIHKFNCDLFRERFHNIVKINLKKDV